MAGYSLKIMMDGCKPPVWRRVIVPDKIFFEQLHEIIQVIYDWDGYHLHEFAVPSKGIVIGDEDGFGQHWYNEKDTLIDDFVMQNKTIQYMYDFGDSWKHKIIFEKILEEYKDRFAKVIKFKGDNFEEDSGGVYFGKEDDRRIFDLDRTNCQLENMKFKRSRLKQNYMNEVANQTEVQKAIRNIFDNRGFQGALEFLENTLEHRKSELDEKVEQWNEFVLSETGGKSKLVRFQQGEQTIEECLNSLGEKQAKDYCKYLNISTSKMSLFQERVSAIEEFLGNNFHYALYVIEEDELLALVKATKNMGNFYVINHAEETAMIKGLCLGLLDIEIQNENGRQKATITFSQGAIDLLKSISSKEKKQIYSKLKKFDEITNTIMLVYGVMDLDILYQNVAEQYSEYLDRVEFNRMLYWWGRMGDYFETGETVYGMKYIMIPQMEQVKVVNDLERYAKELEYCSYGYDELEEYSQIRNNEYIDMIGIMLTYQLGVCPEIASELLSSIYTNVKNGYEIDVIYRKMEESISVKDSVIRVNLWATIVGLMLETEMPMLKGYIREEAAEIKGCSSWELQMVASESTNYSNKKMPLYEFPKEVQEKIFLAYQYCDEKEIEWLVEFMEYNSVKSEEYMIALGEVYATTCHKDEAIKIANMLSQSSKEGKVAARYIMNRAEDVEISE